MISLATNIQQFAFILLHAKHKHWQFDIQTMERKKKKNLLVHDMHT